MKRSFTLVCLLASATGVGILSSPNSAWAQAPAAPTVAKNAVPKSKAVWPYNLFSGHGEAHPGRK